MANKTKKKKLRRKVSKEVDNASDTGISYEKTSKQKRRNKLKSSRRLSTSAADYLGKSHQDLLLMSIKFGRKQSELNDLLVELRAQMENQARLMEMEPHRKDVYQSKYNELVRKFKLVENENKFYVSTIQNIDKSVRSSKNRQRGKLSKAASTSVLNFDASYLLDKSQLTNAEIVNINEVPLQDDYNIENLKRQQQLLESELIRVRGLLTHSTKKLEEKAVENAKIEHEMVMAKNKLNKLLDLEQEPMVLLDPSSQLENELAHINTVIDDLQNRRNDLSVAIDKYKKSDKQHVVQQLPPPGWPNRYQEEDNTKISLYENVDGSLESSELASSIATDQTPIKNESNAFDNDEFFTLNIDLDDDVSFSEINNNEFRNNINNMCQFDPNKDLQLAYGDLSIVDQQIQQIYNYQQQLASNYYGASLPPPASIKTVREVKREAERRKHHQAIQSQLAAIVQADSAYYSGQITTSTEDYSQSNSSEFQEETSLELGSQPFKVSFRI